MYGFNLSSISSLVIIINLAEAQVIETSAFKRWPGFRDLLYTLYAYLHYTHTNVGSLPSSIAHYQSPDLNEVRFELTRSIVWFCADIAEAIGVEPTHRLLQTMTGFQDRADTNFG